MIEFDLIEKINSLFATMNQKQQVIGRNLIINESFKIFEERNDLYLRDLKTGIIYNLNDYIKSKCNCE